MTAIDHAVGRIERMVEDAWHRVHLPGAPSGHWHWHVQMPRVGSFHIPRVATKASERALPMASALMMAGCIGGTDPTVACPTSAELGGSGGDQVGGASVARAAADLPDDDLDLPEDEPPAAAIPCDADTPWWLRSTRCVADPHLSGAIEEYPQEVLPQLRGSFHSPVPGSTPTLADSPGAFGIRPGL